MLAAPSGAAGFVARHHTAALSVVAALTGVVTAAAAASVWFQSIVWLDAATLMAGAVLAFAVAYWHTRHLALAMLVAATPLPGLVWAAPLSAGAHFGAVPFVAYGFAYALATLYVRHTLDRVLGVAAGEPPWRAAAVVLGLTVAYALIWFYRTENGDAALQAVGDIIGASASVLLLLPLSAALVHCDEAFVAKVNRARERRGRLFEHLGGATIPRWGLSFTGVALIFLALGWFGAEPELRSGWWRYAVTIVVAAAALGPFAGGRREALGLLLVTAIACLLALWWRNYDARLPFGAVAALEVAMLACLIALSGARLMRLWRASGDEPAMARRRALEDGSGAVFATLGAAAAALPSLVFAGAQVIVLAIFVGGLCGALLPAVIVSGLDAILPRRRSVDDVFGHQER
jgi:hypothetical protein